MYISFIKSFTDRAAAVFLLLAISPVFLLLAILLYFSHRENPFFIQARPGKNGKIFKIIKFKTMVDSKDAGAVALSDFQRLTPAGKWVRMTSLDEIPQLINVAKGEMSLVGPRPLLVKYLPLYSPEQRRRHLVKPGITGWAQVNGRNALSWEEKFRYDLEYVENISPALDLKIIFKSVQRVIARHGVNADSLLTMEEFKGLPL